MNQKVFVKFFIFCSKDNMKPKKEKRADKISEPVLLEQYVAVENFKKAEKNQVLTGLLITLFIPRLITNYNLNLHKKYFLKKFE